jgi:predicted secreted protein
MAGKAAFGTLLKLAAVTIANVTKISGPSFNAETLDTTAMDSGGAYREQIPSFLSAGEVQLSINFDPQAVTHKNVSGGLLFAFNARSIGAYSIVFPTTPVATAAFNAYVTKFEINAEFDKKLEASVTLTIDGAVTWTYV